MTNEARGFPGRLQHLRIAAGLSVDDLASRAGLTPATVAKLELRARRPTPAAVAKLAAALGVDHEALVPDGDRTAAAPAVAPAAVAGTAAPSPNGHDLTRLTDQLMQAHRGAVQGGPRALQSARRAGELLMRIKDRLSYGSWLPWLRGKPEISMQAARAYMRIARHWPRVETMAAAGRLDGLTVWSVAGLLSGIPGTVRDATPAAAKRSGNGQARR